MRPSKEDILKVLEYDRERGLLIWKVTRGSKIRPGDVAGTETSYGSLQMSLFGQRVQVSHVAWFLEKGWWPTKVIDHRDRDPKNNRIKNLRDISQEINVLHEIHKDSEEGVYETSTKKFAVVIRKNNVSECIGSYKTKKHAFDVLEACVKIK